MSKRLISIEFRESSREDTEDAHRPAVSVNVAGLMSDYIFGAHALLESYIVTMRDNAVKLGVSEDSIMNTEVMLKLRMARQLCVEAEDLLFKVKTGNARGPNEKVVAYLPKQPGMN